MKAGFSKTMIDARPGLQLSGFVFRKEKPSTHLFDPLYIRTVVLDQGNFRAAVLCYDLLALGWGFVDRVRMTISEKFKLPEQNIIFCCTHTHSAPASVPLVRTGQVDEEFLRGVEARSLIAVEEAMKDLGEVTVGSQTVRITEESYNRRKIMENGMVMMSRNPMGKVVKSGPVDEDFGILKFDAQGKTKGVIMNFGAHACTVCEMGITADYPGELCRLTEEYFHHEPVAIFWPGAAGNVNPPFDQMNYESMKRNSQRLFSKIKGSFTGISTQDMPEVELRSLRFGLALGPAPDLAEIQNRIREYSRIAEGDFTAQPRVLADIANILNTEPGKEVDKEAAAFIAGAMVEYNRILLEKTDRGELEKAVSFEISVLQIGKLRLIFLSAEVFAETALALKKHFGPAWIISVSHGAGEVGYVPTREALTEGGYESAYAYRFFGLPAPPAQGAEELVREKVAELISGKE